MISNQHYFQKPHSPEQEKSASDLLASVNAICHEAQAAGAFDFFNDPDTGCPISGRAGGDGDGGFRTPGTRTGALGSAHRRACGVDVYDPGDKLDMWLDQFETDNGGNSKLEAYGVYRESPKKTPGWVHLQSDAPVSGKRTFDP